jgi:uncharacterized tellurite resistance protein B-like protein
MFADFLKRLTQPDPAPLAQTDARLALTALLVRVARTDNSYDASEARMIDAIVGYRYGLSDGDAIRLRSDAEVYETEAPDTVRFTRAIKDAVPYDERLGVIEALWRVVLADGHRSDEENALLRLVASLIGVTDTDSALARQRIEAAREN